MNSHQCGTVVAGSDPARSVLDPWCRTHDLSNLWVVDGSHFPSSAAMNPALTIAAQALRVVAESELTGLTGLTGSAGALAGAQLGQGGRVGAPSGAGQG